MTSDILKIEHIREANRVLSFFAVVDGAILAGVSQLASWAMPMSDQVQAASITAIITALLSLAFIMATYLMREGMAVARLKKANPLLGPPPKKDPNNSRLRQKFLANSVMFVVTLGMVSAWSFGVALIASLLS